MGIRFFSEHRNSYSQITNITMWKAGFKNQRLDETLKGKQRIALHSPHRAYHTYNHHSLFGGIAQPLYYMLLYSSRDIWRGVAMIDLGANNKTWCHLWLCETME